MTRYERTLYRDTADQKIAGVCSGLARYFDIDPLLVRVAFVAGIFISGATLVAYPLLWWLVEPAPEGFWAQRPDEPVAPPTVTDDQTPGQQAA